MEIKGIRITKTILKMDKLEDSLFFFFQNLLQSYTNQDGVILAQGHIHQWNRTESLEINSYLWFHIWMNFNKCAMINQWGKE